ncbi:hypothetical protein ARALYDRAFT_471247 [Arabidopsis lyrata subsp. lyrata]|uniref:Uncharacterized protein n=1 Tax=Arabidopsis lyrata subsp. lyrata TaxID=81972 RepID=D7KLM6_ARALL|nr:hypothetical protein ARALYDRAFT_471247 [Arabidopsis lyrata subsp. lyrata]
MRDLEHLKTNLNHPWPPIGAPMNLRREEPWKSQFDDSVNAVSFGFVATAILISMFLVMAIFERLIRTTTTSTTNSDSSSSRVLPGMDSRMTVYSNGVSVLMPGDDIPTSATADKKDDPVSGKNTAPPPSVVDEETVVKEVLSETTLLTSSNDNSTVDKMTTTKIQEDEEKKPGIVVDVVQEPVLTKPGTIEPEKGSEVSEICSLSESLLSIVNGYDEEEVKQMKSQVVRQRSPAKSRNRVMVSYPNRRTDMSPRKRHSEEEAGSVRLVPPGTGKRDPTERSERRSRSPAMNRSVMMGPTRSQQSTDSCGAMRRQNQSPGRVRLDPNKNGSEQDCNHHKWPGSVGNYNSTPNDSFENPLVSLECFIFL